MLDSQKLVSRVLPPDTGFSIGKISSSVHAPKNLGKSAGFGEALSYGKLPLPSERLLDSEGKSLEKLCSDLTWQPRLLILTSEKLLIAHPGHDEVSDQIPLVV